MLSLDTTGSELFNHIYQSIFIKIRNIKNNFFVTFTFLLDEIYVSFTIYKRFIFKVCDSHEFDQIRE